ncbi:EAL and HDOD domain-containing protein [Aquitalea sp. USM4]|uniref:EAL and HDOD domain-containing protein n=1 Tax=Aquitalea sp. USM4 TaxID=1590041 RepID=UPI00103C7D2C|nr:HDOD domain-containing protein [Aquitalea sp. USM4]QBJ79638.1 competence protein [Aquitalea sp. USM4]
MFKKIFGGLLNRGEQVTPEAPSVAQPPAPAEEATSHSAPLNLPQTLGFVSHQPIQDKSQRIVAYEFSVKDGLSGSRTPAGRRTFDRVLFSTLKNMNIFRLLTFRRAFIHVSLASLDDLPSLELPSDSTIYMLDLLEGEQLTEDLITQLDGLRGAGLRFAVEPARYGSSPTALALYQRLDYLVLDFAAPNTRALFPLLEQLPQRYPQLRWLARNINTAEELALCRHAKNNDRFALFHGSYLSVAQQKVSQKEGANQGRVLEIMRLLRANAPTAEVEAQFKLDSVLLFKLLRFVNSPVNGLSRKIQTIEEGLMLLGRNALFKWLSLLLFTSESDSGATLSLLEKSLIRAHFMEELGIVRGNKLEAEHLFLTGMFSLLGDLLNMPLREALEPLDLPFMISDALLHDKGLFVAPLQLAKACEQDDSDSITWLAASMEVDIGQVNSVYMEAVVWAQEVLSESEVQSNVDSV